MEALRSSPLDPRETPCPACGAAIGTASIGRRRRVQCPKCREVVEIKKPQRPPEIVAVPDAETTVPLAKIEALEARISALEEAVTAAAPVQPIEITIQQPERRWKWIAHSEAHEAERLPTNVEEVFLHNLRNYDGHTLTIRASAENPLALARATALKKIFERAQWTIEGPLHIAARNTEKGLFLAVGGLPLPPAAAATYFAMTASGFAVQSFLDPKLAGDETVLIVA